MHHQMICEISQYSENYKKVKIQSVIYLLLFVVLLPFPVVQDFRI